MLTVLPDSAARRRDPVRAVLPLRANVRGLTRGYASLGIQQLLDPILRSKHRVSCRQRFPNRLHDVSREANVTALSATFVADQGTVVHVENSTRSKVERCFVALCRKRFVQAVMTSKQATCDKCRKLDNPFHAGKVPFDPTTWIAMLGDRRAGQPNAQSALLSRDLITLQGVVTPRGVVLSRDLTNPVPWVDDAGITHARLPAGRRLRGACGADLLGIRQQVGAGWTSYEKLARATKLYADVTVDCMTCLTVIARMS